MALGIFRIIWEPPGIYRRLWRFQEAVGISGRL
jgi:hypothetical protein